MISPYSLHVTKCWKHLSKDQMSEISGLLLIWRFGLDLHIKPRVKKCQKMLLFLKSFFINNETSAHIISIYNFHHIQMENWWEKSIEIIHLTSCTQRKKIASVYKNKISEMKKYFSFLNQLYLQDIGYYGYPQLLYYL